MSVPMACAICGREGPVALREWVAPRSGDDPTALTWVAAICDECEVTHWAEPLREETRKELEVLDG